MSEIKIIAYDTDSEKYRVKKANQCHGLIEVCTIAHFLDTVCKTFEKLTPKMDKNPLWQDREKLQNIIDSQGE